MRYLILFNKKFPYKSGEAFLENEIDEIASYFDKVIIFPLDVFEKDVLTRTINAGNVDVRVVHKTLYKFRQFWDVIKSPFYFLSSKENSFIKKALDAIFISSVASHEKKVIDELKSINFSENDEVYLYSYWLYVTAAVAYRARKYFDSIGVKTIFFSRAHRFDIYEEKRRFGYLPQREFLLSVLDKVYTCSDNGKKYLEKKYHNFIDKIDVSYLGTYDHGIGKYSDRKVLKIVSCSRLTDVKRVNLIIETLRLFQTSSIKLEWTHLGGGELFASLNKDVQKKLSWMDVHMVGSIPNKEVYDYYLNNEVDLFINVSSSEGLPVSIMEATSFGIPVIATDVGGTGEIVVDGESGKLLRADFAIEELAESIKKIAVMSSEEYVKLRKSTRLLWEKNYQAPINYSKFVNDFLRLDRLS